MTTSWAHLVRGELTGSLEANVGGTVAGMLAVIGAVWLTISAVCGRWLGWAPNATVLAWVGSIILLITLVDWGFRLVTG